MSGYGKNGRTTAGRVVVDWYKVLQISPSSTPNEIKTAYYKIAQSAHPDKHNGCSKKLEQFKRINEAYDILSNPTKRSEYDIKMGHYHHHNANSTYQRRTTVPKDYRKVHFSRPPPEWKMVWDHAKHYEMHYGDGFQKEAIKQALRTAEQDGTLIYRSSLGKGFSFAHLDDRTNKSSTMNGSHPHGATTNSMNYNPYSKNPVQGPPKIIFDYQEVTHNFGSDGGKGKGSQNQKRQHITKHERIVYDLHLRRYERYRDEVRHESQHTTPQQDSATYDTTKSTETASATSSSSSTKKSPIYSRYDERYQTEQQQQQQQQQQQPDPLITSIHLFSSFMGASTVLRNGDGDDKATTTNDNTSASRDDGATSMTPPNERTDHPMKNSSCIIM